jgi:hypothetical protein
MYDTKFSKIMALSNDYSDCTHTVNRGIQLSKAEDTAQRVAVVDLLSEKSSSGRPGLMFSLASGASVRSAKFSHSYCTAKVRNEQCHCCQLAIDSSNGVCMWRDRRDSAMSLGIVHPFLWCMTANLAISRIS